jgi:hypothetical protein
MSKKNTSPKPKKGRPDSLPQFHKRNATEVLSAFLGWLASREKPLILSTRHDYAPVVQIASEFIKVNKLPRILDNAPKLKWPQGTDHLTNEHRDQETKTTAKPVFFPADTVKNILEALGRHNAEIQNAVLSDVLYELYRGRKIEQGMADDEVKDYTDRRDNLAKSLRELDDIVTGGWRKRSTVPAKY